VAVRFICRLQPKRARLNLTSPPGTLEMPNGPEQPLKDGGNFCPARPAFMAAGVSSILPSSARKGREFIVLPGRLLNLTQKPRRTVLFSLTNFCPASPFVADGGQLSIRLPSSFPGFPAQGPRTSRRQIEIMRYQNRGEAVGRVQPFDQVEDAASGGLVQVACRLVGQQQTGIVDQRAGQRHHTLLFAARSASPAMLAAIFEVNFPQSSWPPSPELPACARRGPAAVMDDSISKES